MSTLIGKISGGAAGVLWDLLSEASESDLTAKFEIFQKFHFKTWELRTSEKERKLTDFSLLGRRNFHVARSGF